MPQQVPPQPPRPRRPNPRPGGRRRHELGSLVIAENLLPALVQSLWIEAADGVMMPGRRGEPAASSTIRF